MATTRSLSGVGLNTFYDFAAFLVVAACMPLVAVWLTPQAWPSGLKRLVLIAVVARLAASVARLWVITDYYRAGDALRYYDTGWLVAAEARTGNFEPFFAAGQWWGTPFVERVSAAVLMIVGPSIRAEFVVFSMFPLIGLVMLGTTFLHAFPQSNGKRASSVLLLWPSLLFWPSSVGKESIILLALGLIVSGYVGHGRGPLWGRLALGVVLMAGIRPHIAMMCAVAMGLAEWLAPVGSWSALRIVRGGALALVAVFTTQSALSQLGIDATVDSIQTFVEFRSGQTAQGGSRIELATGPAAIPMSFVNVFLRPFPWEVGNPMIAVSAFEVLAIWWFVWSRRHTLRGIAKWRSHRFLLLALPLGAVLVVFYGAFVGNLGILARQRVVILPLFFLIVEGAGAAPAALRAKRKATT